MNGEEVREEKVGDVVENGEGIVVGGGLGEGGVEGKMRRVKYGGEEKIGLLGIWVGMEVGWIE